MDILFILSTILLTVVLSLLAGIYLNYKGYTDYRNLRKKVAVPTVLSEDDKAVVSEQDVPIENILKK